MFIFCHRLSIGPSQGQRAEGRRVRARLSPSACELVLVNLCYFAYNSIVRFLLCLLWLWL